MSEDSNREIGGYSDDFDIVRLEELRDIDKRREVVKLPRLERIDGEDSRSPSPAKGMGGAASPAAPKNDVTLNQPGLIGLCLSGGGMRSASFSIGVIQTLHKLGLWRLVDYLSTVSGGGYAGSHMSSAAATRQEPFSATDFPLPFEDANTHKQVGQIRRFLERGHSLFQPLELANNYLIGVFFNSIAIVSGVVAITASVAFLCRCTDYPAVRDRLALLDLDRDVITALLPSSLLLGCWLTAWGWSYLRRDAEAPGRAAKIWLVAWIASLILGVAVLIGNGDISFGLLDPTSSSDHFELSSSLRWWLLSAVGAALLPLLKPWRLLKSGLSPQSRWERYTFKIVSWTLLVGLPAALVAVFARENISEHSTNLARPLSPHDIENLKALATSIVEFTEQHPESKSIASKPTAAKPIDPEAALWNAMLEGAHAAQSPSPLSKDGDFKKLAKRFVDQDKEFQRANQALRESNVPAWFPCAYYFERYVTVAMGSLGLSRSNEVTDYWSRKQERDAAAVELCAAVDSRLLSSRNALKELVRASQERSPTQPANAKAAAAERQPNPVLPTKRLDDLLEAAEFTAQSPSDDEVRELNWALLQRRLPRIFRPVTDLRRVVVIDEDQFTRLRYAVVALLVFLIASSTVDVNATSLHRYYRERIGGAFIVGHAVQAAGLEVKEMRTTEVGAPYHLINATVGFHGSQVKERDHLLAGQWSDVERRIATFFFSQRWCGSSPTGFIRTHVYEQALPAPKARLELADVTALSGAAVATGAVKNWLITVVMFALNLRLGQWMPHPARGKPRWRSRLLPILFGMVWPARSRYCFLTDGGHSENLGLLQLLRRRCRVILASDASHDPNHHCEDLSRALRLAEVHLGVKVVPFDGEADGECGRVTAGLHPAKRDGDSPADRGGDRAAAEGASPHALEVALKANNHHVLARIIYPDAAEGILVYFKPCLTGDECDEIRTFDLRCPEFPHEPTADQLFDEDQIWAYIKLGRHIVLDMCEKVFAITPTQTVWNAADLDGAKLADRVSERRKGRGHETTSNPSGNVVADVSVAKTGGEESVAATVAPTRDDHPATAIHAVAAGNGVTVKTKRRTRKRRQRHQPGKPR